MGGMRTKYKRSQDLDFGLRLAQKGILLLRKKDILAYHNTLERKKTKIWGRLLDKSYLYNKSILYRDHIFNKHVYKLAIRNDYTLLSLIILLFLSLLFSYHLIYFYFLVIGIRVAFSFFKKKNIPQLFLFHIIKDLIVLIGFIFFFPKGIKEYNYQQV